MGEEDRARLRQNLKLAEQLGGKIATVYGDDIARQIAEYARVSGMTKIVLGCTGRRGLPISRKSLIDTLMDIALNLDVYIIPDSRAETVRRQKRSTFSADCFLFHECLRVCGAGGVSREATQTADSAYLFKIGGAVFADRTNKVGGELFPFIHITAHLAAPAFFGSIGLRLRFDVGLVVGVCHRCFAGTHLGVCHIGDKQRVGAQINRLHYLAADPRTDVLHWLQYTVLASLTGQAGKLVDRATALKAKSLEHCKRSALVQYRDGKDAGIPDQIMGKILLVHGDRDAVG